MNKQIKQFVGAICILILVLLLWPRKGPSPEGEQAAAVHQTSARKQKPEIGSGREAWEDRRRQLEVPYENPIQAAMVWSNAFPDQALKFAAVLNAVNVPIKFYGLCLDQDDKLLENVNIAMRIRQWRGISRLDLTGDPQRFPRTSDKQGRFELTGVNGDVATVESATLTGYEWMRKGDSSVDFQSGQDSLPSITSPVILRFWKKRGAEPLYVTKPSLRQRISTAGTPVAYDLKTGAKVEQSENPVVRFSLKRHPESLPNQFRGKFDWQFTVEVPGGGVQATHTNMPFLAPTEGYAANASFGFKADDPTWGRDTNAVVFFKTALGQYGRLEFGVSPGIEGTIAGMKWSAMLNPSGSPVLEFDPAKTIRVPPAPPVLPSFQPRLTPPAPPASPGPPQSGASGFPQLSPAFQAMTNRNKGFGPPVPPPK